MTFSKEALLNRPSFEAQAPRGVNLQTEVSLTITYLGPDNITLDPPSGQIQQYQVMEIINTSAEITFTVFPDNFYEGQTSRVQLAVPTGRSVAVTAGDGGYTIEFHNTNPGSSTDGKGSMALVGQVPIRVTGGPNA